MRKLSFRTHASVICMGMLSVGITPQAMAQDGASQEPTAAETDSIVVTGRRAALQSADDRKKNAISIVDSVVADDAGKLPDNSITEVLPRAGRHDRPLPVAERP
jgi:hypothetical protein